LKTEHPTEDSSDSSEPLKKKKYSLTVDSLFREGEQEVTAKTIGTGGSIEGEEPPPLLADVTVSSCAGLLVGVLPSLAQATCVIERYDASRVYYLSPVPGDDIEDIGNGGYTEENKRSECDDLKVKESSTSRRLSRYTETAPQHSSAYSSLWPLSPPCPAPRPLPIVALDCEMCDTSLGLELTRITVVDENGRAVLDSLVLPDLPILNYRSEFSGITPEKMAGVGIRLVQIQHRLLQLISAETVVIGHALENDLHALRLVHRRCVDTSLMYPHPRGFPCRRKLKQLAKEYLDMDIQTHREVGGGHDSLEDSAAALSLALLKASRGPSFGLMSSASSRRGTMTCNLFAALPSETVTSCMLWNDGGGGAGGEEERRGRRNMLMSCVGGAAHVIRTGSDGNILKSLLSFLKSVPRGGEEPKKSFSYVVHSEGNTEGETAVGISEALSSYLEKAHEHALVIQVKQRSSREARALLRQKRACRTALSASVWTDAQEAELRRELEQCHLCRVRFIAV